MRGELTFPVITVETLARFSFPSLLMLIWKTFMPKQRRETNIEGRGGNKQYVFSWNDQVYARAYYPDPDPNPNKLLFMFCFPEVFQQIMTGIVAP